VNVTRFAAAPGYAAPADHRGMSCLRLQGHEAGPSDQLWLGVSHLLPGGGTDLVPSPIEKHYVVLAGTVEVSTEGGSERLGPWDSVRFAPGEARRLSNPGNEPATILLAMPLAPPIR
jgi:mannose-6-phosphate isomerase-like protein (cupin superfamily)